jgi:phage shock protein C
MAPKLKPMGTTYKRLTRSRKDRVFCGICGGFAEYLNIPSGFVRIGWIILSFVNGLGILLYLLGLLFMPKADEPKPSEKTAPVANRNELVLGSLLIVAGMAVLMPRISHGFDFWHPFGLFWQTWNPPSFAVCAAIFFIVIGTAAILRSIPGEPRREKTGIQQKFAARSKQEGFADRKVFSRSRAHKAIAGVCGGIGEYLGIDPVVVRIAYAVIAIGTNLVLAVVVYAILAVVLPKSEVPANQ